MPREPVLTIEIDDSQFKAFSSLFDQYQEKLKDTTSEWHKASSAMNRGFGEGSASKMRELSNALNGSTASALSLGGALRGVEGGFGRILGVVTGAASLLKGMVTDIARLGLAAAGAAAGAAFAYDRLSGSAVRRVNEARSLGVGTGRLQAFNIASSAYGLLPTNAPETIRNNAADLRHRGLMDVVLSRIGMTPEDAFRHPVRTSLAVQQFAHNFAHANRDNPDAFAPQQPIMQSLALNGFDLNRVMLEGNTPERTILAEQAFIRQNRSAFHIDPEAMAQMAVFRADLKKAGAVIETDLINRLRVLGPNLGKTINVLTGRFVSLLDTALSKRNIDSVRNGLERFDAFVSSKQFTENLHKFEKAIGDAANMIEAAVTWVHQHLPQLKTVEDAAKTAGRAFAIPAHAAVGVGIAVHDSEGRGVLGGIGHFLGDLIGINGQKYPAEPVQYRAGTAAAEDANGLPAGTMWADALAESGGNPNAHNAATSARGLYQQTNASVSRYGFGTAGAATQLAQNMATARLLLPSGTELQHLKMAKAANILGDQGFMRYWAQEKAKDRSQSWLYDMGRENSSDVVRFISALPKKELTQLLADNKAGQPDEGISSAQDQRTARSDLASAMQETARNTALIAKRLQKPAPVKLTSVTPTGADSSLQTAAAAGAN